MCNSPEGKLIVGLFDRPQELIIGCTHEGECKNQWLYNAHENTLQN